MKCFTLFSLFTALALGAAAQTTTRNDAGLSGSAGAVSGFFETFQPTNYPQSGQNWWHLLDVRHSNTVNNYAMQFAGAFDDQQLFFRKTNNSPTQAWSRVLAIEPGGYLSYHTLSLRDAGGHAFFSGRQLGGGYVHHEGIFHAVTENLNGTSNFYFDGYTGSNRNFYVRADGQGYFAGSMLIGTTNEQGGYKLAVNGNIKAKEIRVEAGSWPDYVFSSGYKLPTLSETAKYIQLHGHLPGIPSAKEVVTNGISLGEMNRKLLEKVEELTLHLIEKDKQIAILTEERKSDIESLRKEIRDLKSELTKP